MVLVDPHSAAFSLPPLLSTPLPDLATLQAAAHVVALPLNTRFRGVTHREAMLFHGPSGWSEFAPFLEYQPAEAAQWLAAAINHGWGAQPAIYRDAVPVNASVPAVDPAHVGTVLQRFPGCTTVKLKVAERGQTLRDDVARVRAIAAWFSASSLPQPLLRLDANGGWDVPTALTAAHELASYRLDYIEQPCATVAELAELRAQLQTAGLAVRVAADESIRKASDPLAVARANAADLLVVKAAPLGGAARALQLVAAAGLPAVVSSALDTSVGIAAGVRLAAALPPHLFGGACGLGTAALLQADVTREPLLPVAGQLPVVAAQPDAALLREYAVDPARRRWWFDRLAACYEVLAAA